MRVVINSYMHELCSLFILYKLPITDDFKQPVNLPTRGNHILDLVSTHPDRISQVEVVQEISDHEPITFQLDQPLNKSLASKLQKVY